MTKLVLCLAVAAALAPLVGCGSSPSGPDHVISTPTPAPPTPPPPVVVSQGAGFPLEAGYTGRTTFTTARGGALDVTVDWTYASNDVDVLVARGDCSFDQLDANQCNILGFSISTTAKPEKVHVESVEAGTYTLFVDNAGSIDEAVSFQVVLTPRASGVGSLATGHAAEVTNALGRKRPVRGHVEMSR